MQYSPFGGDDRGKILKLISVGKFVDQIILYYIIIYEYIEHNIKLTAY